jgi:SsrA-binding protein
MKITNRKARYNYEFLEHIEAGIVLLGSEVKSVRQGHITLDDAFVRIDPNLEVWLINCHIHPYKFADNSSYDPKRSRKLLLHKKETLVLLKKMEGKNLTVVPTSCYTIGQKIKLELALARGKKFWEKKNKIKQRDLDIDTERIVKGM